MKKRKERKAYPGRTHIYIAELKKSCDIKRVRYVSGSCYTPASSLQTMIMSKPDNISRYMYIDYSGTYPGGKTGDYYYYSTKYKCLRKIIEDGTGIDVFNKQSSEPEKEAEKKTLATEGKKKLFGRRRKTSN